MKKGKAKEEVVAAPPPPVQSIPDLLAAYPTSFQHHRDVQTLSLALQPGSAENEAALTEAAKAQYLSNVADLAAGPSFAELVQALQERARGPALPSLLLPCARAPCLWPSSVGRTPGSARRQRPSPRASTCTSSRSPTSSPTRSPPHTPSRRRSPPSSPRPPRCPTTSSSAWWWMRSTAPRGPGYLLLSFPATASQARLFTQLTTGYLPSPSSASLPPPSHLRAVIELIVTDDRAARRCLGREVDAQASSGTGRSGRTTATSSARSRSSASIPATPS